MSLATSYLGLSLKNPLVAASSPLSQNLDNLKRMEDAGISAVVLHSLFEEQISREKKELFHQLERGTDSFSEAQSFFPEPKEFVIGPEEYLEHIRKAKSMVSIPIIASLNGHTSGGWTDYAKQMQQAGADALELNVYFVPTDPNANAAQVEEEYVKILRLVKANVTIPVSIKLSPFFSAMANFASRLDKEGADGLVLFNRFYQPDIDLENLEIVPGVILSTPMAMRLPLRWIAILYGKVKADLAGVSGIHNAQDVIKMVMSGARATMLCSTLYKNKIAVAHKIINEVKSWMEEHEYESIEQMRGSMSQKSCEDPESFERANYIRAIKSDVGLRI